MRWPLSEPSRRARLVVKPTHRPSCFAMNVALSQPTDAPTAQWSRHCLDSVTHHQSSSCTPLARQQARGGEALAKVALVRPYPADIGHGRGFARWRPERFVARLLLTIAGVRFTTRGVFLRARFLEPPPIPSSVSGDEKGTRSRRAMRRRLRMGRYSDAYTCWRSLVLIQTDLCRRTIDLLVRARKETGLTQNRT